MAQEQKSNDAIMARERLSGSTGWRECWHICMHYSHIAPCEKMAKIPRPLYVVNRM